MLNRTCRPHRWIVACAVLTLALCFSQVGAGDTVTFVGTGCELNVKVEDITESLITVVVRRSDIDRLRIGFTSEELCSDTLTIKNCTDEFKVKVVSMSQHSVVLVFPKKIVATLETRAIADTFSDVPLREMEGRLTLRADTYNDTPSKGDDGLVALRGDVAQLAQELETFKDEAEEKERTLKADMEAAVYGRVRGTMVLANGMPYAGHEVKVRRLIGPSLPFGKGKFDDESLVFAATTDKQGVFLFERLPDGPYDIYWIPPRKSYWVRLFKDKPAFRINAGGAIELPNIKADMRVIGQ